jgi:hypothetical protein
VTDDETEWFPLQCAEDSLGWVELPPELAQAVEGLLEVGDELVVVSGLHDPVIHVNFNIAM